MMWRQPNRYEVQNADCKDAHEVSRRIYKLYEDFNKDIEKRRESTNNIEENQPILENAITKNEN